MNKEGDDYIPQDEIDAINDVLQSSMKKSPKQQSPDDSNEDLSELDFGDLDKFGELSANFADELSGGEL